VFYKAKSGQIVIDGDTMNYIEFGTGEKVLAILPGLGDGLSPVHGKMQAIVLASTYKQFARDFKVYIFSRRNHLERGCSTRSMAEDQAVAMKAIGISKASIMGVSQGGMIAQYLAIDYPNLVERLVLAVTLSRQNETVQKNVCRWIELAKQRDYKGLIIDTTEQSYSETYLKKYRFFYPLLGMVGKPKSFDRFLFQATSCVQHNSYSELDKIVCPTLVIGGERDKIVGIASSLELAEKIKNSELFVYKHYGHATYEEARDFNDRVFSFLCEVTK